MEISIPIELQAKLTRLAAQQGRDSGSLIVEAVERMVDYDEWFLTAVEKGLAQIENGQTLSHQDAGQRIEKYLTLKQPQV
jgi:predicted transcriptional regulator